MAEPSPTVMDLARLRACRSLPGSAPAHLHAAAAAAGRELVAVGHPGSPAYALGWAEGSEPAAGHDTGVVRHSQPAWLMLTFAACLHACWPEPEAHPFPGVDAAEQQVLTALAALGSLSGSGSDGSLAVQRHQKSALRRLRHAGLLDTDGAVVRVGPQVAIWSAGQLAELRAVRDLMPGGETE